MSIVDAPTGRTRWNRVAEGDFSMGNVPVPVVLLVPNPPKPPVWLVLEPKPPLPKPPKDMVVAMKYHDTIGIDVRVVVE